MDQQPPISPTAAAREPCLNCGATLTGEYCANCGQRGGGRVIALWTLLREFTGDLLNLDSRLWRSLVPLLIRPGFLTTEYLDGRRVRYFPPFRLYLVLSLIFFLLSNSGDEKKFELSIANDGGAQKARQDSEKNKESAQQRLKKMSAEADQQADIDMAIDDLSLDQLLPPKLATRIETNLKHNPQAIADKVVDNLPVAMLLFLPLIALFMRLLYIGSSRYFVEDLLFFTHFHASAFLILSLQHVVTLAVSDIGALESAAEALGIVVTLYVLVYLFLAMRRVYGKRLLKLRYLLLVFAYGIGLITTFVFTAAFAALLS